MSQWKPLFTLPICFRKDTILLPVKFSNQNCYRSLSFYVQAPSFVFVDEIDAIAGRHARKDPRRRATFEALIAQLDGE